MFGSAMFLGRWTISEIYRWFLATLCNDSVLKKPQTRKLPFYYMSPFKNTFHKYLREGFLLKSLLSSITCSISSVINTFGKTCFSKYFSETQAEPGQTYKMEIFAKIALTALNYFHKKPHLKCLTGFWVRQYYRKLISGTIIKISIGKEASKC